MTDEQKEYLTEGDGFIDIKLRSTATIAGAKINVLRMREPIVADDLALEAMKGTAVAREIQLFANLCEVAPDDIKNLTRRNYNRLQEAWENFTD
jgi:hypothetical protein